VATFTVADLLMIGLGVVVSSVLLLGAWLLSRRDGDS
jgi:hypothetical protein